MTAVFLACLLLSVTAQPTDDPFAYSGPFSSLCADGVQPAPVTSGIPFSIAIAPDGSVTPAQKFELRRPAWSGAGSLDLAGVAFAGGKLSGSATVVNGSGSVLEGLRLDITGASESYKAKDDQGKEVIRSRVQAITTNGPILFADLQKGASSAANGFEASGLKINPETTGLTVHGVVSGLYLVRTLNPKSDSQPMGLDFDASGRLYVVSGSVETIYRLSADGSGVTAFATIPATGRWLAVSPKTGEVVSHAWNADRFFRFSSTGGDLAGLMQNDEVAGMGGWASRTRFGRDGSLYVNFGATIAKMAGDKPAFSFEKVGAYDLEMTCFDVAPNGDIWVGSNANVFRVAPDGKNGARAIIGPSMKLGKIAGVHTLRCDAQGNVYVADRPDADHYPRVCVFSREGRFVRVFGRGSNKPLATEEADGVHLGQINTEANDLAFAPDGRVFVSHRDLERPILVFEPF
ncbi:MAG: hypothetical protein KIS66_15810 [Fimbriimonadaceae bacterium]|nr:hypothetical protein [Fimbriimonadaceae bacterium]